MSKLKLKLKKKPELSYIYIKEYSNLWKNSQGIHTKEYEYLKTVKLPVPCLLISCKQKETFIRLVNIISIHANPDKKSQDCDVTNDRTISFSYIVNVNDLNISKSITNNIRSMVYKSVYDNGRFVGPLGLGIIPDSRNTALALKLKDINQHISSYIHYKTHIEQVFMTYINLFKAKTTKNPRLTEYEEAFGFTEITRVGSKKFASTFGSFIEDIYNLSPKFKLIRDVVDGISDDSCYESKCRHDTMKQSLAVDEISSKLKYMELHNKKKFYLLILIDKDGYSVNKPLHHGNGLSKIVNHFTSYNPEDHRWVSGDEVYKLLFDNQWLIVKNIILDLLRAHS